MTILVATSQTSTDGTELDEIRSMRSVTVCACSISTLIAKWNRSRGITFWSMVYLDAYFFAFCNEHLDFVDGIVDFALVIQLKYI